MGTRALAALISVVALAAGCGGDDENGGGSNGGASDDKAASEPQIALNDLRTCLERAGLPVGGSGRLAGKGISREIPLIAIGGLTGTNLLVLESPDAAKRFVDTPPQAASLVSVVGRKGNVVKARGAQPGGGASRLPPKEDAAVDRCVTGG